MTTTANHTDERLAWYLAAGFGLFVHWGPYSQAGVEASWPIMTPELSPLIFGEHPRIHEADYVALAQRFNPVEFDARAWVRLAQEAGMRYLIITTKHHDGFCMFDAPGTEYKITRTPFGRDVCAELAEACAAAGLKLGFYYSPPDMHHPGYRDTSRPASKNWLGEPQRPAWASYLDYMESQLRALLTGYGPVAVLWFDGLVYHDKYDPLRFHRLVHELSPQTLINDRLGAGYDFITPEQFIPQGGVPVRSDKPPATGKEGESLFRTVQFLSRVPGARALLRRLLARYADGSLALTRIPLENRPAPAAFQPWETCMTMNRSWGYNPRDAAWKPAQQLIRNLVEITGRGGNYLLNVGPTPQGSFPPQAVERLQAIGTWMARNGRAIHDTTYGPLQTLPALRSTRGKHHVYLHLLEWPAGRRLVLEEFEPRVAGATILADGSSLVLHQRDQQLEIELPARPPDGPVSVLALALAGGESGG